MTDPHEPAPYRDPVDAVRHSARVLREEAALLAEEHPVIGTWLEEIASAMLSHVPGLALYEL